MFKVFHVNKSSWPEGISDGLSLPCSDCGHKTSFDYTLADEFWERVVPPGRRKEVICLDCLEMRAKRKKLLLCNHLLKVQYTAGGETIVLVPESAFVYDQTGE